MFFIKGQFHAVGVARLGRALCLGGAGLGAIGLIGWLTGSYALVTLIPGQPLMVPNTAISLLLLGVAGALRFPKQLGSLQLMLSISAAILVLIIGAGALTEYATDFKIGIDQLFVRTHAGPQPGRPSPPMAAALICLSTAILIFDLRLANIGRPSEWLILCAGVIATTSLLGQLFGAGPLYRFTSMPIKGVSVHGALSLLMVSLGLLMERPDAGVMRLVTAPGPGAALLRRLAPSAILSPVGFALIAVHLVQTSNTGTVDLVFAALVVVSTVASLLLLAITAVHLNRTHDMLEQTRAETRELIDLASDGIFVADLSGRYVDVNRAGCEMLGYSRDEILARTILDIIVPEDAERLSNTRTRLLNGAADVAEWTLRSKDGRLLPVEISAKILPGGRWQGFVRDISERKRVESEQNFLVEMGGALPTTLDLDDALLTIAGMIVRELADFCIVDMIEDNGKLRRARVACRDGSNARLSEMLMPIPPNYERFEAAQAILKATQPVLIQDVTSDTLRSWGLNEEQVRYLQQAAPKSAIIIPLLARGRVLGRVLLISAASVRKFEPRDLRFAERIGHLAALSLDNTRLYRLAQQASRAREDVLGVVAHDLRNPLQIIAAGAEHLRRRGPESAQKIGAEILDAVHRMKRLIQDLLDVASAEAGHLLLTPKRLHVAEVISNLMKTQMPLALSASIELRLSMADDIPDIWADHDRLLQVFENLIGNAIKFTKSGGHITLSAEAGAGEVLLSVSDTGSGIAENELPHVFDRFWQAPKSANRGAGLGLPIVKGIVEAHGGHVWVRSVVGQGSTFFFTIPTAARTGTAPRRPLMNQALSSPHSPAVPDRSQGSH